MNQFAIWRSLMAIAAVYAALLPQAAQAGWLNDRAQEWYDGIQQPETPSYIVQPDSTEQLQPINRDGFGYINDLGGGTDEQGNYRQPVSTQRALGSQLPDGTYEAPVDWDRELGIEYQVQDGAIVNQGYRFYPGGQR